MDLGMAYNKIETAHLTLNVQQKNSFDKCITS